MPIEIRKATPEDLDTLTTLNEVVQRLHVALDPSIFRADVCDSEVNEFFEGLIQATESRILLARLDHTPVGYVWFELQERPQTPFTLPRRRIYVHHIVVAEAARRAGVASTLLRAVEDEARANSIDRIVLDAWAVNASAQRFFQATGYHPFNFVLGKQLG